MRSRLASLIATLLLLPCAVLAQDVERENLKRAQKLLQEGKALIEAARFEEALIRLVESRALFPREVEAPFYMAQCEFNLGMQRNEPARIDKARMLLREAERLDPRFGGVYYLWGVIGIKTKNFGDAVVGFRTALEVNYRVKDSRANLAQALYGLGGQLAVADVEENDTVLKIIEEARDRLEALKDDWQFSAEMRANFRDLWIKSMVNLAAVRQRANDLPHAERILKRLIKLEPENPMHHFNLGLVFGRSQRWEVAMESYEKALELSKDPDWVEPLPKMGYIRSQQRRPEEAERYFARFLEKNPNSWVGHFQLGDHFARRGELDRAIAIFARCVEINRSRHTAMYKLAQVLRRARRIEEADKWLNLFREVDEARKQGTQLRAKLPEDPEDGDKDK